VDDTNIDTSGGGVVDGGVETGGGDFTGRDKKNENIVENHVTVNIPMPTWANTPVDKPKRQRQPARRGELMADAAMEIWKTIGEMKETMGGLRQAVDINSQVTKEQANSTRELSAVIIKMGEQIASLNRVAQAIKGMGIVIPDADHVSLPVVTIPPAPWWRDYVIPTLLTAILFAMIFYMATGGRIP
jgi:hypothetical protein